MTTPYTLMRCWVRDLMSCFNSCKVDDSAHRKPKTSTIANDQKHERKKQVKVETTAVKVAGQESPVSWQSCESEEDDYIVFYFQDDDAGGDVIESSSSGRKQNDVATANRRKKHETGKRQVEAKSIPVETKVSNECDEHKDTLEESSDSSTSSFVFPTIQREWTGSPVLMPRPEGHDTSRSVCVQCCKF